MHEDDVVNWRRLRLAGRTECHQDQRCGRRKRTPELSGTCRSDLVIHDGRLHALTFRSTLGTLLLMSQSTESLARTLTALTRQARALGLTDTEWAERAGVRKETLSRLRRRQSCEFETIRSLAQAVGARLGVLEVQTPDSTPDGHFPTSVDRDYEEGLFQLSVSGDLDPGRWAGMGPRFFMAGLAVMLASTRNRNRRGLLALAEHLHPGASEVAVFNLWLERSPLRPTRFLSFLDARTAHAA
jgi:DNA-binding phage protein